MLLFSFIPTTLWRHAGRMLCVLGAVCALGASAQPSAEADTLHHHRQIGQKVKRTGSLVYRFMKGFNDFDTTYIAPNRYNYTFMGQSTSYYQLYKLEGRSADGNTQSISTKAAPSMKIGPYFGWRWIFLGYTFDVTHPHSGVQSQEFNLSLYSAMLGCDLLVNKNSGEFRLRKAQGFEGVSPSAVKGMKFKGLDVKTVSFSAYYVKNHRHFSYPATYNQSTEQLRSCGSLLVGGGFSKQHVKFNYTALPDILLGTEEKPLLIDELKMSDLYYKYYYISAGYGYNWVIVPHLLLGGSVMPTIGLRKMRGERIKTQEVLSDLVNLSLDCTMRAGLVYNDGRWFAGLSYIGHLLMYRKHSFAFTNSINYCNLYAGFYFGLKKAYRRPKR